LQLTERRQKKQMLPVVMDVSCRDRRNSSRVLNPEKCLRQVRTETDGEDIVESRKLAFDLSKSRRVGDEKEQATFGVVADRRATDRIQVEGTAGEETGDVRHGSGMVADAQVENDGRHNDR
jgi:hypothetical protein